MPAWAQAGLPVVALIVGALLTYWTEGRREAIQDSRAERVRQRMRAEALADRRVSLELDYLHEARVALQDAAHVARRHANTRSGALQEIILDTSAHESTVRQWRDELNQAMGKVQAAMVVLLDDKARGALRQAGAALSRYGLEPETAEGRIQKAQEAIGSRIRILLTEGVES